MGARRRCAAATGALLLGAVAALAWQVRTTPAPPPAFHALPARHPTSEGLLLARDGTPLHRLRVDHAQRRAAWVPLAAIAPALRDYVVRLEDRRFATHAGVDWRAVAGAVIARLQGRPLRGASTLSMQLAARLAGQSHASRRTLRGKWAQMRAAWALERAWTKDQILEAYLNLAGYRGEIAGIGAAARLLFGKAPDSLDRRESLLLALLLRSPNAAAPALATRACALLPFVAPGPSCAAIRALTRSALGTGPAARDTAGFGDRVAPQLAPHVARRLLDRELREVRSALDARAQAAAVAALVEQLAALEGRHARDGAVLVLDNASGEVLAYVGNPGRRASAPWVDGVRARRQAGSTLKPFLYQLAIAERYLTAASLLDDSPLNLETPRGLYVPQNYARDFRGLVSVRESLAGSLNIPAVRVLMLTGPDRFLQHLRRLGFVGLDADPEHYGYSLALGSAEVSLWELTNAYRALALRQSSATAPTLLPAACAPGCRSPVAAPDDTARAAFVVSDILADRSSRSASFGLENPLTLPFWAAVKTGTSKHMRDNWCVGFSDRYTVGVWVGNFDGSPMQDVSGLSGAAPVWASVMRALHAASPGNTPPVPAGVTARRVRFAAGGEPARREWFLAGTEQDEVRAATAMHLPRIVYPGRHSVLALDPDIPSDRQRVFFRMRPERRDVVWVLDGERHADAAAGWTLRPGEHRLRLVDPAWRTVDEVSFSVRGTAASRAR